MDTLTQRWSRVTRVGLLLALAMGLAGCVDLSGQEATGPAIESPLETPEAIQQVFESPLGTPTPGEASPPMIPTSTRWNYFPTLTAQARITPSPWPTPPPPTPRITPTPPPPPKVMPTYDPRVPLRAENITLAAIQPFGLGYSITFKSWSPDGTHFLFGRSSQDYVLVQFENGAGIHASWDDLWVADANSTSPYKLADLVSSLTWSPDGQSIAYLVPAGEQGVEGRLYVTDIEHLTPREIAACDLGYRYDIAWLPTDEIVCRRDGVMYAIKNDGDTMRKLNDIFVSDPVAFSGKTLPPVFQGRYRVSPNGAKIAYLKTDQAPGWWISNLDGSNALNLEIYLAFFPTWSPDSSQLVYGILNNSGRLGNDLWVISADGSNPHRIVLAEHEDAQCLEPAWSPDSAVIAYTHKSHLPSQSEAVWVVNADGTNPRLLVDLAFAPQWSPRGSELAVLRRRAIFDDTETLLVFVNPGQ